MAGVSGDFKKLGKLASQLSKMVDKAMRDSRKLLAAEAHDRVMSCFERKRGPYGHPWRPNKKGTPTLEDTRRLRNSIHAKPTSKGFELATRVKYAAIHNYGGRIKQRHSFRYQNRRGRFVSDRRAMGRLERTGKTYGVTMLSARTIRMPKRQFIPDPSRPLPVAWSAAFKRIMSQQMRQQLRGVYGPG